MSDFAEWIHDPQTCPKLDVVATARQLNLGTYTSQIPAFLRTKNLDPVATEDEKCFFGRLPIGESAVKAVLCMAGDGLSMLTTTSIKHVDYKANYQGHGWR